MPSLGPNFSSSRRTTSRSRRAATSPSSSPMNELPAYSSLEVAKHSSPEDAWVIIGGKVLNISTWLHEHPGGDVILLDQAGRDATREFEDVGHSADARQRLDELVIGTVRPATDSELRISRGTGSQEESVAQRSKIAVMWAGEQLGGWKKASVFSIAGVVVIGAALAMHRYTSSSRR